MQKAQALFGVGLSLVANQFAGPKVTINPAMTAGRRIAGRKRNITVDTLGFYLVAHAHAAAVPRSSWSKVGYGVNSRSI